MSKRSKKLSMVVLGAVPLALAGCGGDEPVEAQVFPSVTKCISLGNAEKTCIEAQESARIKHDNIAPRYMRRSDCETDFDGACEVSRQGYFVPAMAGFLMGAASANLINNRDIDNNVYTQPLYRSRDDWSSYRTSDNKKVGSIYKTGRVSLPSKAVAKPSIKTTTLSRGGFGSSAAARGSWGGSSSSSSSWGG